MSMHTWFECKIRYEKMMVNGMAKKITESYLVDALSFTEAEKSIIEEMSYFISGEFTVTDIKRANYSELFTTDDESADRWFKCKVTFITLDEKSGAEKKTSTQMLVQASDLRDALKRLDKGMEGTMADHQIAMVAETPLMDIYPYEENKSERYIAKRNFIQALPEGSKTTISISGKSVTVDKTGKNTVVTPEKDEG